MSYPILSYLTNGSSDVTHAIIDSTGLNEIWLSKEKSLKLEKKTREGNELAIFKGS